MSSLSVKKAPLNMKNKDHFTLGQLREAGDMLLDQGKLDDADGIIAYILKINFLAVFYRYACKYC